MRIVDQVEQARLADPNLLGARRQRRRSGRAVHFAAKLCGLSQSVTSVPPATLLFTRRHPACAGNREGIVVIVIYIPESDVNLPVFIRSFTISRKSVQSESPATA